MIGAWLADKALQNRPGFLCQRELMANYPNLIHAQSEEICDSINLALIFFADLKTKVVQGL